MALRAVFVISRGIVQDARNGTRQAQRTAGANPCTWPLFGGRRWFVDFRRQGFDHFEHASFVVKLHGHAIS